MDSDVKNQILKATGAKKLARTKLIQRLWNDYGELLRIYLRGGAVESVILKHVKLPTDNYHRRGFNTELSKQRKIHSYRVEINWYEKYNKINLRDHRSRTARKLASFRTKDEFFILMEDLDAAGFSQRVTHANLQEMQLGLAWLANFHAKFIQHGHSGLWETGSYWHLETRPDELEALADPRLRETAALIDKKLANTPYLTLIHGDAKLANFCFTEDSGQIAAVDFQYVGRGCGMKDVAYFVGSCLNDQQCEQMESEILDFYFRELIDNIGDPQIDKKELEAQWRALYPVAWADFHRFLKGWSPGHWKINSYSERTTRVVVESITQELLETAKKACLDAGEIIRKFWKTDFEISAKEGASPASSVVTEVDLLCQEKIISILKPSMEAYGLGLLVEEGRNNKSRFKKDYFWSVDPLDGTLPFSEGKPGFAVTIALINKAGAPLIGVAYDPVADALFHAVWNQGSYLNGRPLRPQKLHAGQEPIHLFADRSLQRLPNYADLEKDFIIHFEGGAVMNVIGVLLNPHACYFKYPKKEAGGCAIWDLAAVSLILKEAGGVMTGFKGEGLSFNKADTLFFNQEGIMACSNKQVYSEVRKRV